jgi:glycosyltransferase involved in cell wall biosynthesis
VLAAVESALNQTLPPLEVIVVNDGSTDDTAEALAPVRDHVQHIYQANSGVAEARNRGVLAASGDLIAFLDADDVWLPAKLERQTAAFAADPQPALVHCGVVITNRWLQPIGERTEGLFGANVRERMLVGQGGALHASGSTMVVTRTAFDAIGPFDARLPPSEDWDMTFRIARDFEIAFVPEPLVLYRQHGANAHRDIARTERAMTIAFGKAFEHPDPSLQPLPPRAYGFLHLMLAGSAWELRDWGRFVRHAAAALRTRPSTARAFLGYPARRLGRAWRSWHR